MMKVITVSANPSTRTIENPVERSGGLVWYLLHSEREDVCEALLKESRPRPETRPAAPEMSMDDARGAANWHRELLQSRLRQLDDALDRLISGSFGNCRKCGRCIEDTKLALDHAIAFCVDCWLRMQTSEI